MDTNESTPTVSAYEDVVRPGGGFGYGLWPIIDRSDNISEDQDAGKSLSPPPPLRRGRGRPPVKKPRDDSAIEVNGLLVRFMRVAGAYTFIAETSRTGARSSTRVSEAQGQSYCDREASLR
jgi:hypothetical protein